jgi:hypothetical protein
MRWCVDGVELKSLCLRGIYHVVSGSPRHHDSATVREWVLVAVDDACALSRFDAKELIVFGVHLFSYFLTRRQAHQHELTVWRRIEHAPKVAVLERSFFNVRIEPLHESNISRISILRNELTSIIEHVHIAFIAEAHRSSGRATRRTHQEFYDTHCGDDFEPLYQGDPEKLIEDLAKKGFHIVPRE